MKNTKLKILGIALAMAIFTSLWGAAPAGSNIMDATFRASVPAGGQAILGFVIGGTTKDQSEVLIRGICPGVTLPANTDLSGAPDLVLYRGSSVVGRFDSADQNTVWNVPAGSTWALLLPSGSYCVVATNTAGSGELSLEVHILPTRKDPSGAATDAPTVGLVNVSGRVPLATGTHASLDFATRCAGSNWTVVRAIGPGLQGMGEAPLAGDPRLAVLKNGDPFLWSDDWEVDLQGSGGAWADILDLASRYARSLGASPLEHGSKDAFAVMVAFPGFYTAVCENNGTPGEALIEVYIQP